MRCLELNKLESLAIGASVGLQDGDNPSAMWTIDDREIYGWWNAFCGVIKTRAFLLEQLVVEGAETGR